MTREKKELIEIVDALSSERKEFQDRVEKKVTEAEKAEREAKINNFMNIYMNQYSKVKLGKNGKTFPLIEEKRPIITEKPLVEQVREMAEKAIQKEELEVEMLRWGTTMYSRLSQSNWGLG